VAFFWREKLCLFGATTKDGVAMAILKACKNISILARIIAAADAFDAMTTERPYKKAVLKEKAMREIVHNSGIHFDPGIVHAAVRVLDSEKRNPARSFYS